MSTVMLPDWIYLKKGIVSPRCSDKDSFKFMVLMSLFPEKHTERVSKRMKKEALNFYFSESSSPEEQVDFFEENNEVSVSVLTDGPGKSFRPWRIAKKRRYFHVVLFFYCDRFFLRERSQPSFRQGWKKEIRDL